jgi:hypothetical protein
MLVALLFGVASTASVKAAEPLKPTLVIDSPTDGESTGRVVTIKFHAAGLKIAMPGAPEAQGEGAVKNGHIHVRVDDATWIWLHATDTPVVISGLTPGPHNVKLELAEASHKVVDAKTVNFTVAAPAAK